MRKFDHYLESVISENFRLAAGLNPDDYKITSRLSDWTRSNKKWQAKTLVANNGGPIGKFENVGYIAINLKSNEIIPISVNDEHKSGYEFLHDMKRQFKINPGDWYTISNSNYIYDEEGEKDFLEFARQWKSLGGNTGFTVHRSNVSYDRSYNCTIEEFIEYEGNPPIAKDLIHTDTIKKEGMRLISLFEKIALALRAYHKTGKISDRIYDYVLDLKKWDEDLGLRSPTFEITYHYFKYSGKAGDTYDDFTNWYGDKFKDIVMKAMNEEDMETIEQIIFGMDGLKNVYHAGLKYALKKQNDKQFFFDYRNTISCFGSIEATIREFDRISGI